MQTDMFNPVSTYRIQFHKDFTFSHLDNIIPYLKQLGIKTLYASPVFSAVPGSNHGYDGTDPLSINPEIGTLEELRSISHKLKVAGISWLQDIVPNHMAFHHHNKWLMDLLKNGPESQYKNYFDQSLADSTLFQGPMMVPFLGEDLATVIDKGELKLAGSEGEYFFSYADQEWPVNTRSIEGLQLENIDAINNNKEILLNIAGQQHYRLCSWKETDEQINYRRFFTVNSLICINIQHKEVFDHFHQFIYQLVKEDIFQGIRIDHIDGLYDPDTYLKWLRELLGEQIFIVAEKILAHHENLPDWPIQGTTGYDFLAQVNNLFTNTKAKKPFSRIYGHIAGTQPTTDEQIKNKKRHILTHHMAGELNNLTDFYIEQGLGKSEDRERIKQSIEVLLINFPVYRHYGNRWPLSTAEQQQLNELSNTGYHLFKSRENLNSNDKYLQFYQRCMQFSGPLMAKGVEDTLMYTYNRFTGHNEVGDSPAFFGIYTDAYHLLMQNRRQQWPLAINATSTHDTKRGEDARARLNVLTYLHDEWQEKVTEWQALNKDLKTKCAPDSNDEYFIYQTLIGTYPALNTDTQNYGQRLCDYLEKVLREAKVHSNWANPNEEYETAVKDFAVKLLDNTRPFWKSFVHFWNKVKDHGVVNSLAQLVLKITSPGTPDIYQGCELWDLSMVDPDNRRPVDYELRKQYLNSECDIDTLWENRDTGQIKAWLLVKLLELRRNSPDLFTYGEYKALKVTGKHADRVMAFARVHENKWIITAVPLSLTLFSEADIENLENLDWDDTKIHLPDDAPLFMHHVLTGFKGHIRKNIKLNEVFTSLPLAVLELTHSTTRRSAGLLLHITSLPSGFGVGDFGPAARKFAMLLKKGMQRYWQILPLSPVTARDGFSPYSSNSSQAGNILLVSPQDMVEEGMLTAIELQIIRQKENHRSDLASAGILKQQLLDLAWANYKIAHSEIVESELKRFCETEDWWLKDYTLYCLLKKHYNNEAWNKWPDEYKYREPKALDELSRNHADEIEKIKWQQFIFNRQWLALKRYCNSLGIKILGDLPFYISYDSADVWANPDIFELDSTLNMINVCGVPPDYFNEDGQRWGMPIYDWGKLKQNNYKWWVKRIHKNLMWHDVLRLDHFRAFAAYWNIPVKETTARNGKWVKGPGDDLFKVLSLNFPDMPFVAEDLGEIDEPVHTLANKYQLPGMKVLQFAFGDDVADSPHINHHHCQKSFAYTGTHDNNTVLGWYRQDADKTSIKNLKKYTGIKKINEDNIVDIMIRLAFSSVSDTVITPLQDWLKLDEKARMNTPATEGNNWIWQLTSDQMMAIPYKYMRKFATLFGRA